MKSFERITKGLVVILLGLACLFLFNYSFKFLLFLSIPLLYDHLNSLYHNAILGADRIESIYFELPKVLSTFLILRLFILLVSVCLLWIFLRRRIKLLIIELSVATTITLLHVLIFFNFNSLIFFDLISFSESNNNLTYYLLVNGILLMIASVGTFILLLKFLKWMLKKRLSKL